jgi:hypothetical protein
MKGTNCEAQHRVVVSSLMLLLPSVQIFGAASSPHTLNLHSSLREKTPLFPAELLKNTVQHSVYL